MKISTPFLLTGFYLLAITFSCFAQQKPDPTVTIQKTENNLIDARTLGGDLSNLFDSKRTDTLPRFNIADRMQAYQVPGVSLTVIRDFRILYSKGYGLAENGQDNPVDNTTLFQAASCSKPLATAIVMKLVEDGKLSLDKDVNSYLKRWQIPYDTITGKVTLRQLINHQAGINRPGQGYDYAENSLPTLLQVLKGEYPAINDAFRFDMQPGTAFHYSNFGYMIIQMILEDQLQKPYRDIVAEYIFKPLSMKSSYMEYPLPDIAMGKMSKPHNQQGEPQPFGLHPSALANAGLATNSADLATFAIEMMLSSKGKSEKVMHKVSAEKLFQKSNDIDPVQGEGFSAFGLGWFLIGEGQNCYFAHPGGNNSGASCVVLGNAATGDGVVIMTNGIYGLYLSMEIVAAVAYTNNWKPVKQ